MSRARHTAIISVVAGSLVGLSASGDPFGSVVLGITAAALFGIHVASLQRGAQRKERTSLGHRGQEERSRRGLDRAARQAKHDDRAVSRAAQGLWSGFVARALEDLRALAEDESRDPRARARALLNLGVWEYGQREFALTVRFLQRSRSIAAELSDGDAALRDALQVDALVRSGDPNAALRMVSTTSLEGLTGEVALIRHMASAGGSGEGAAPSLGQINLMLRQEGLAEIEMADPARGLCLDNLTSTCAPGSAASDCTLSVIMPAKDAEAWLPTAVDALQRQTWGDLELIIVDDGSEDRTLEVARGLAQDDPRIRVLESEVASGAYIARNRGLAAARGELITVHDADDWSHPQKLQRQAELLRSEGGLVATISSMVRVTDRVIPVRTLSSRPDRLVTPNFSSLMVPRWVFAILGPWDEVQASGDSEFRRRLLAYFGAGVIGDVQPGVPLSFVRSHEGSLTADSGATPGLAAMHHVLGARRLYIGSADAWHASRSFREELPLRAAERPQKLIRPRSLRPTNHASSEVRPHDTILLSALNLIGGTTSANVAELRAQAQAGLRSAVVHHPAYGKRARAPINPKIWSEAGRLGFDVLAVGDRASCDTLVVRFPQAVDPLMDELPEIRTRRVVVVVNQTPLRNPARATRPDYDIGRVDRALRERFDAPVTWFPIGPAVRSALESAHAREVETVDLAQWDWVNIIAPPRWRRPSPPARGPRIRIGRHSRDGEEKWPTSVSDLRAAYPSAADFEVRVLGGAAVPASRLGGLPENWTVWSFDALKPGEFLADLDVFVHFTHPEEVKEHGRAVLEALAVGVPVITSPELEPILGDAAIYVQPSEAEEVVRRLVADPAWYAEQVRNGHRLVDERFSYEAHIRRLAALSV